MMHLRSFGILPPFLVVLVAAVTFLIVQATAQKTSQDKTLGIYCAAGLQRIVQPLADEFERRHEVHVETHYGGSGELVALIQMDSAADLFIGADIQFNQRLGDIGFVDAPVSLMKQRPVLVLSRKGLDRVVPETDRADRPGSLWNRKIQTDKTVGLYELSLRQVQDAQLRWSLAKPRHAAIGSFVQQVLSPSIYQQLLDSAVVSQPTVTQVLGDLQSGVADAGFLWDSMLIDDANLVAVTLYELGDHESTVAASVVTTTANRALTLKFVQHCVQSNIRSGSY